MLRHFWDCCDFFKILRLKTNLLDLKTQNEYKQHENISNKQKSIKHITESEINTKWGEYMSPIMKIDVDENIGFPFLLPLMMHLD